MIEQQSSRVTDQEDQKKKRGPERIGTLLVLLVLVLLSLSVLTIPVEQTRAARYEVVSSRAIYWIERDARFDASISNQDTGVAECGGGTVQSRRTSVSIVEREGTGGMFWILFRLNPEGEAGFSNLSLKATEIGRVQSEAYCPGFTVEVEIRPPRIHERFRGISGANPEWELHAELILRELENKGGDYVVNFSLEPGGQSNAVLTQIPAGALGNFSTSFNVSQYDCCVVGYAVNAPKLIQTAPLGATFFEQRARTELRATMGVCATP